ncbi:hypothetical protein ABT392_06970 [Paucibacter sp. JuS9]|uniref:hypothetical protein n=1 Tax=Paucibacter sp. JuS9 TaxID=3228748 RepID=UPI003757A63A
MALFKYGEAKWCDKLAQVGGLRVGTLHDFRRDEHKRGIADPSEGTKSVHYGVDAQVFTGGTEQAKAFGEAFGFKFGPGVQLSIKGCAFNRQVDSEDFFIYCLASRFSGAVLREFEGADACVRITHVRRFCDAITHALESRVAVEFIGAHRVIYTPRHETWNGVDLGKHPALVKEPSFAPQCEVRALWRPTGGAPICAEVFESSDAHQFCERIL